MSEKLDLTINKKNYDRLSRSFTFLEKTLGINIQIHGNEAGILEQGDIFLFNHFARFETVIPPHLIYKETGAYCRTITDHRLFEVSEGFTNFLTGGGAVPNNLKGLLAFLAAEILKGRKVSIFPEGGMIKDRRVLDDEGQYSIFSHTVNQYRKHHRGAAVLALTLDVFKQRVKDLFENGDYRRIAHWCEALDIETPAELKAKVDKPTLIVPATITFNPIRIDDNIITKGLNLFNKHIPDRLEEELAIEGNILLKDTDMDIRFSKPIVAGKKWTWWDKFLLTRTFINIQSLDDLFSLSSRKLSVYEKVFANVLAKESDALRDAYMMAIYTGITVNLSHITSELIMSLIASGITRISKQEFHKTLYIAIKGLQHNSNVFLHKNLSEANYYNTLLDGTCEELNKFIETCMKAQLIEMEPGFYIFLAKLLSEQDYNRIRLENPVLVCANEAKPIKEVAACVEKALKKGNLKESDHSLALHLFDDEMRLYNENKKKYSKKEYDHINKTETATKTGEPYLLIPNKINENNRVGILLVHGFTSSPAELKDLGEILHGKGHPVMGVRLAGHGTSPADLGTRTWQNWLKSIEKSYRIIEDFSDEVIVVGFSMGGSLSLLAGTELNMPKVKKMAIVCAPIFVQGKLFNLVPMVDTLNKIARVLPHVEGVMPYRNNHTSLPEINYQTTPLSALHELYKVLKETDKNLERFDKEVVVIQATNDPVVDPRSAQHIMDHIASKSKKLHMVESDIHGIITEDIGDTRQHILQFIEGSQKQEHTNKQESTHTEAQNKDNVKDVQHE